MDEAEHNDKSSPTIVQRIVDGFRPPHGWMYRIMSGVIGLMMLMVAYIIDFRAYTTIRHNLLPNDNLTMFYVQMLTTNGWLFGMIFHPLATAFGYRNEKVLWGVTFMSLVSMYAMLVYVLIHSLFIN